MTPQCEIWWVYRCKHLIDLVKAGKTQNKKECVHSPGYLDKIFTIYSFLESIRSYPWVSNHYSDVLLSSILSMSTKSAHHIMTLITIPAIPTYDENKQHIWPSLTQYMKVKVEKGTYKLLVPAQ